MWQGLIAIRDAALKLVNLDLRWVLPGQHRCYARSSEGGGGVVIRKHCALAGKSVNIGRGRQLVPIQGHIFSAQGVERDQHKIGFWPSFDDRGFCRVGTLSRYKFRTGQ